MIDQSIFKWLNIAGKNRPSKFSLENKDEIELSLRLIQEELDELKEAVKNNDKVECIDSVVDLKWVINNFVFFAGLRPEEIQHNEGVVRKSNYSKFCTTKQKAEETVFAYAQGIHPDKEGTVIEAYYKEVQGLFVVLRKSDDKILKSIDYTPAKIVTDEDMFGPASQQELFKNEFYD
jgi:hypothetical protein